MAPVRGPRGGTASSALINERRLERLHRGELTPDESYALSRLDEGTDPTTIADEMQISDSHLSQLLWRLREAGHDVPYQQMGRPPNVRDAAIDLKARFPELTNSQIAERIGSTTDSVKVTLWNARRSGLLGGVGATVGGLGLSALSGDDAEASVLSSLRDNGLETAPWSEMGGQEQPGWNERAADLVRGTASFLPPPFNLSAPMGADLIEDPGDAAAEFAVGSPARTFADTMRSDWFGDAIEGFYGEDMSPEEIAAGRQRLRDYRMPFFEEEGNLYQDQMEARGGRDAVDVAMDAVFTPLTFLGAGEAGRGLAPGARSAARSVGLGAWPETRLPHMDFPTGGAPEFDPRLDAARYVDEFQLDNADLWRGDGGADPSVRDLPSAPPPPIEGAESFLNRSEIQPHRHTTGGWWQDPATGRVRGFEQSRPGRAWPGSARKMAQAGIDRWRADRTAAQADADTARDASMRETVHDMAYPPVDNAGIHAAGAAGLGGLSLWLYGALTAPQEEESIRADPAVDLETYRDTPFYRPVESLPPYGGAEPAGGSATPILTAPGGVEGPFAVDLEQWSPEQIAAVFGEQGEEEALVAPDSRFFRHEEIDDANEIRDIQERINETEYGPIEVDGSAKDETWGAIGRVAAGFGAPKPASLTDAYPLILGARQEPLDVRDIQTVLMRDPASAEIMEGWGADGDYGPLTERALETAFPGYDAPPNTREPTPDELMEIWRSRLMRRRAP